VHVCVPLTRCVSVCMCVCVTLSQTCNPRKRGTGMWYISHRNCLDLQIVVGGRNKYQINGHLAQPSKIQNLFHSVQLNVNNPHFLIMQGRITKVLNMKPMETLSMLEEAAGTRMYEMKKEAALKTLEKKQTKVDEIDSVLSQDIVPAFEKLRKERAQYMQWTEGNAKVDRLQRFCIAYKYSCAEQVKDAACNEIVDRRSKITELHDNIVQLENAIKEKEVEIVKLTAEKEMEMNSDFKLLAQHADKLSKELVKVDSSLMNQKDNLEAEKAAAKKVVWNPRVSINLCPLHQFYRVLHNPAQYWNLWLAGSLCKSLFLKAPIFLNSSHGN